MQDLLTQTLIKTEDKPIILVGILEVPASQVTPVVLTLPFIPDSTDTHILERH